MYFYKEYLSCEYSLYMFWERKMWVKAVGRGHTGVTNGCFLLVNNSNKAMVIILRNERPYSKTKWNLLSGDVKQCVMNLII